MGKRPQGKTFVCGFSLNCKCFPANHDLVNQQYKSTEMLQQKFYCEQLFSTENTKVFPCGCFPVHGIGDFCIRDCYCNVGCQYGLIFGGNRLQLFVVFIAENV